MTEATKPSWMPDRPHDYPSVMNELIEIVSSRPDDYVYPRMVRTLDDGSRSDACSYWHLAWSESEEEQVGPGEPGCIVGHILHAYGVPRDLLVECDQNAARGSTVWGAVNGRFAGLFTREVNAMLGFLQSHQDAGTPWSKLPDLAQHWMAGWRAALRSIDENVKELDRE